MAEPPQLELSNLEIQNAGTDSRDGKTGEFSQQSERSQCCKTEGSISFSPELSFLV
jgi:hypothetical protein